MASNTSASSHLRPCRPVAAGSKDFLWYSTPEEVCGVRDVRTYIWGRRRHHLAAKLSYVCSRLDYGVTRIQSAQHTHTPTFASMQPGLCMWVVDSGVGFIFDFILS